MGEPGEQNHFTKSVAQTERERALKSAVTRPCRPSRECGLSGAQQCRAPQPGCLLKQPGGKGQQQPQYNGVKDGEILIPFLCGESLKQRNAREHLREQKGEKTKAQGQQADFFLPCQDQDQHDGEQQRQEKGQCKGQDHRYRNHGSLPESVMYGTDHSGRRVKQKEKASSLSWYWGSNAGPQLLEPTPLIL